MRKGKTRRRSRSLLGKRLVLLTRPRRAGAEEEEAAVGDRPRETTRELEMSRGIKDRKEARFATKLT